MKPPVMKRLLASLLLVAACAASHAAPFATTYTGNTAPPLGSHQPFPGIITGQRYTMTLVFDNGGSTAASQTWTGAHLTCVFFHINNARNLVYAQDLVAEPADVQGSTATDASGALTTVYARVESAAIPNAHYSTSGFTLAPGGASWLAAGVGQVFADNVGGFNDTSPNSGVVMTTPRWSAPQPFNGPCAAPAAPINAQPVPGLGLPALALLGAGAAGLGARRLRKRASK